MYPLIVSTFDLSGGAAKAAFRLYEGLHKINVNSRMLVQYKDSKDDGVIAARNKVEKIINQMRPTLDSLPLVIRDSGNDFSLQWFPDFSTSRIAALSPDVINLHWISGFLQIETISRLRKPVVWTLHDMWALTGGCHYSGGCNGYTKSCGACPHLGSHNKFDISRWVWQRKAKAWQDLDITIVAPSNWLAKIVQQSSLFQPRNITVIPNGIDIERYKPLNRTTARTWLNLPLHKKFILIGANSLYVQRKGSQYVETALKRLQAKFTDEIELVIFGTLPTEYKLDLGFKTHYIGNLNDDISLALVYASADVFVAPYIEDNLPNTIMEALACGTPCVAFATGGIPEMIEHQNNGYLATPHDAENLAEGIIWVLTDNHRYRKLSHNARAKIETEFSLIQQAHRYSQLFTKLTNK